MKAPTVLRSDRTPLALGEMVGRGGEGEVWAVRGDDALVAKLYTGGRAALREPKVRAMLEAALAQPGALVSYPNGLVLDPKGRFAGFLMQRVAKAKPLHQLYKPVARKLHFPTADYRFLVHVALNVAKAVASVHETGCVIGDVNESGILVTEKGRVALIDADSFQLEHRGRRFVCEVGKPEYTAPEIQGRPLKEVIRTRDHDCFALAVVVFQLLWLGRHPFSGTYRNGDMPLERAIGDHRFAYSKEDSRGMAPPPGVPGLGHVPAEIAAAFETAFAPRGRSGRPGAADWVAMLERLRLGLKKCGRNPLHYHASVAAECPWCRMRDELGVETFVAPPLPVGTAPPVSNWTEGFDIVAVWQTIERVTAPPTGLEPVIGNIDLRPSSVAVAARGARAKRKVIGSLALAAAAAGFFYAPAAWIIWIAAGWYGLALLFGDGDESAFTRSYERADREWAEGLAQWRANLGASRFEAAKAKLADSRAQYEALAVEERRKLEEADRGRRDAQLKAWLEQFQIRRFPIKGIGPGKVATLASYGIETAAEIETSRLLRVPGFGPATSRPLLEWRRRLEGRFRYDPRPTPADAQRTASIRTDIAARAARLRLELSAGPAELAKIAATVLAAQKTPSAELIKLKSVRAQSEADLRFLGLAVPAARAYVPAPVRQPPVRQYGQRTRATSRSASASAGTVCPTCGSSMVKRTARRGRNAGGKFWGCSRYPSCRGTRSI